MERLSPEHTAERLVQCWRSENVKLNPPADSAEIAKLSEVIGMPVPEDVAAFYSLANGMMDCGMDKYLVSFWPIDQIVSNHRDGKPDEIWFADFLINTWGFFYRPDSGRLIIGADYDPNFALSFGTFLDLYLNNPKQIGLF